MIQTNIDFKSLDPKTLHQIVTLLACQGTTSQIKDSKSECRLAEGNAVTHTPKKKKNAVDN